MARKDSYIAVLDLGSEKTCALVCRPDEGGKLALAGWGTAESRGWRRSVIVNLDSAKLSVKKAVETAEDMAGAPMDCAYVGVGGAHIRGFNAQGVISLGARSREVTTEDVKKVSEASASIALPSDRILIYAKPEEFLLDSHGGIRNPTGMVGTRLEAHSHLITGSATAHESVVTAVEGVGVKVEDTVFEALAAAEACLTSDERELGVALIDVGCSSSGMIVYHEGRILHTVVIPVGGEHFTNDIAVGLRTPIPEAERMKFAWGERNGTKPDETALEVPSMGERPARFVSYSSLKDIIEPRGQELLELLQAEFERAGVARQIHAGVVLVGGGAKLGGFAVMAEEMLGVPVRIGKPRGVEMLGETLPDPAYATLVGLALYGYRLRPLRATQHRGLGRKLWGMLRGRGD